MIYKKDTKRFTRDFDELLEMSIGAFDADKELSDRYASIAYNLLKSKKARPERNKKVLICKNCTKILIPGKTAVVRLEKGFLVYKCLNCGNVRRIGYDQRIRRKSD